MFRSKRRRRLLARRLWTGLVLVVYCAGTLGFPLPVRVAKGRSQSFPCQDHACGCRNAEECWQHCCCFSNEERWAWARDHDVSPPDYAAPEKGWRSVRLRDQDTKPDCPNCQARSHSTAQETQSAPTSRPSDTVLTWQLGSVNLRCQGIVSEWLQTGGVLPPPAPVSWQFLEICTSWLADFSPNATVLLLSPPEPPPRRV
jgi:hypothetical protein